EYGNAELARVRKQRRVPFPRRVRLLIKIVEGSAVPQAPLDLKIRPVAVDSDGVRTVGLQFDGIGTGTLGGLDELQSRLKPAVVIRRNLRNDVGRLIAADTPAVDDNARINPHGFSWSQPQAATLAAADRNRQQSETPPRQSTAPSTYLPARTRGANATGSIGCCLQRPVRRLCGIARDRRRAPMLRCPAHFRSLAVHPQRHRNPKRLPVRHVS